MPGQTLLNVLPFSFILEEILLNHQIKQNRDFMKCPSFTDAMSKSDQSKSIAHPPHGKEISGQLITLHPFADRPESPVIESSYTALLDARRSVRKYDESKSMTQSQLAFLLHSSQGIQEYRGKDEAFTLRPVPSGGARHPFETYVLVRNVQGLEAGLYYYAPAANVSEKKVSLAYVGPEAEQEHISEMLVGQSWGAKAHALVFLTCVAYRSEWRYAENSHRVMLIDLGHVGQNLMLSAASMGLGSCCMAAYDQKLCDEFLQVDGEEEYTVYVVPVGVV